MGAASRVVAVLALTLGACTTFDFPAPSGETATDGGGSDATVDAAPETSTPPDGGVTGFLDVASAARLCALAFDCPNLAQGVEASLVIPIATPATPLNFSGCMDWLAGPVDPARPGLDLQRQILSNIAAATSCPAAYAASPATPIPPGACSPSACSADGSALETCSSTTNEAFSFACAAPVFDSPGSCTTSSVTGGALCTTKGTCSPGAGVEALSCPGGDGTPTLRDCYKAGTSYTDFDCALSGRGCLQQLTNVASCVSPGKTTAPCSKASDQPDRCDGTSVAHCAGGSSAQTEFSCSAVARVCSTTSGVARCWSAADTCTPFDTTGDVNACADGGSTIGLCIAGVHETFDCASIGKACVRATSTQTAHCG
jgi:hypothetical protein